MSLKYKHVTFLIKHIKGFLSQLTIWIDYSSQRPLLSYFYLFILIPSVLPPNLYSNRCSCLRVWYLSTPRCVPSEPLHQIVTWLASYPSGFRLTVTSSESSSLVSQSYMVTPITPPQHLCYFCSSIYHCLKLYLPTTICLFSDSTLRM